MSLRRSISACLVTLASGIVFAATPARPRQTQGPIAPKPGTPVQQAPEGTIRVRVALVRAPVIVIDGKGEPILDLQQKDFRVLDNGTDQAIESIDLGGEPLSAVLVFETSSRIAPLLPAVQKSAIVFTQTVVGPSGEGAVLSYDDSVNRLLPFSKDNDKIEKTIADLKPGNSGARLYDALSAAVGLLRDRPMERRRAIIVVGEASDSGSEEKLGQILREAQLSNIVIYSVGLSTTAAGLRSQPSQSGPAPATPPGTFGEPPMPGTAQTPTSQQQYGGNIDQAVDAIGGELNSQYMLSYRPTGSDTPGYHQIKVSVNRPGVKVRTRPGYYLEAK